MRTLVWHVLRRRMREMTLSATAAGSLFLAAGFFAIGHFVGRRKCRRERPELVDRQAGAMPELEHINTMNVDKENVSEGHEKCAQRAQGINISNASYGHAYSFAGKRESIKDQRGASTTSTTDDTHLSLSLLSKG